MQALREKRAAEQPSKKKRKRADEDEDASTADEMSDSDDAVGMFSAIHSSCSLVSCSKNVVYLFLWRHCIYILLRLAVINSDRYIFSAYIITVQIII